MSTRTSRLLNKVSNNGSAGSTLTVECPIGLTYHSIQFTLNTWTLAHLTEIRVVGNGEILQRYAQSSSPSMSGGEVLDKANQFNGLAAVGADNVVTIDFDRHNLLQRAGQEATAIGTGMTANVAAQLSAAAAAQGLAISVEPDPTPLTSLTLEIDIDAGAGAGSLDRFLAYQSEPTALGVTKLIRAFNYGPTGAGEYEITDLPMGDVINKIYIVSQAGVGTDVEFSRVRVEIDNFIAFDRTPTENDVTQTNGVHVPQNNLFVIDPTEMGYGSEGFVTGDVSEFLLRLTMTDADQLLVLVEYIGGVNV